MSDHDERSTANREKDKDMGLRDAHLRAAAAIEKFWGVRPLTSELRARAKGRTTPAPGIPAGVLEFITKHEALGNVLTLSEHSVIARDAQTKTAIAHLEWLSVGQFAFELVREMCLLQGVE